MRPISTADFRVYALPLILGAALLAGCAQWSSAPLRVEQDFGNSVRQMRAAQTYDQTKVFNPDPEPVKTYDGQKGEQVLKRTYRQDVGKPQEVQRNIIINVGSEGR